MVYGKMYTNIKNYKSMWNQMYHFSMLGLKISMITKKPVNEMEMIYLK